MNAPHATVVLPIDPLRGDSGRIADLAFGSIAGTQPDSLWGSLSDISDQLLMLDLSDPKQRRLGDYELVELIGEGGMGVVYRARQHGLNRDVAVKLLAAGPWASREFVQRFVDEAQNAARMQHPNIVTIYEVGSAEELHFFSMRLIRGESLAALLKREGKLDPRCAAALLRTIAEAVDYAHRLGVLHLDLKPANVLLDDNGNPHVADFGLARRMEAGLSADNHEVSGTPSYMAPEQAIAGAQRITPATDIWGLGAVLYELLTGQPPFLADTPQATLKLVVSERLRNPRDIQADIPRDLAAIVEKCMSRDTSARYASARELADDLARFQNGYMVSARPLNTLQRSARWALREPKILAAAMIAMLALLIGLAATTSQWRRANANAVDAKAESQLAETNAAVSAERLWDSRRDTALRLMRDGQGFDALTPLLANIEEKQSAGKAADTAVERREIGMIEHQGVALIDRFIIPDANPMATALSPDGKLLAVTLNDLSVRWYDTATMTERGRVDLIDILSADQVPVLPRFIDDHRLLVFGEWLDSLPCPATSGGVLIDLDHANAIAPPASFADLADITWSADGRHALLHDAHDRVQLWQVDPWRALSPLAHESVDNGIRDWILDPQLRFAVQFGGDMSELRVFDPHHLDAPRRVILPAHDPFSAWAEDSANGQLALGNVSGQVFQLDPHSLTAHQLPGPLGGRVSWLAFSKDDAWLAVTRSDGSTLAYDVASGQPLHAGQMQANFNATHVDIDRTSRLLVVSGLSAGGAGDTQIWHLPEDSPMLGEAMHLIASPTRGAHAGPYWLSASPRSGLLASAGMDGEIRLWRLPTATTADAQPASEVPGNLYTDGVHIVDVDYDRLRVVSAGSNKSTPWLSLPPPIVFAEMVDGGKTLVAVARTGLHVFDTSTLRERIPAIALPDTPLHMAVSGDGQFAALSFAQNDSTGFRERIELYDLRDGRRLDGGGVSVAGPLRQFTLSPDASRLLTTGPPEGATEVFDAHTGKSLGAYPHDPEQPVIYAAFASDAQRVWMVTRNLDETRADNADLMQWDLGGGKIVERRHVPGVYPVGIAAIGDKPLLAGRDRLVFDPSAADERVVSGLRGGEATTTFAVSRDGRLVAHAFGKNVQIYRAPGFTSVGPPMQQTKDVSALAFSDDDSHLLAFIDPSNSSCWHLWNLSTDPRSLDELRADAALLTPRDAGPRVLRAVDAGESARLREHDPGPPVEIAARHLGPNTIPPRNAAATPLQVDMGAVYNRAPASIRNVRDSAQPAMSDIPFGLARLEGVDYDWRGALEMGHSRKEAAADARPDAVRGLRAPPVPIAALHVLLFAPESAGEPNERVYANVRLHYRDGSEAVLPIRTQREVKGWTEHDRPTPIGWVESDFPVAIGMTRLLQFNAPRLPNPHPDKIVATIDLETATTGWSTPVFFAITAEPFDKHRADSVIVGANLGMKGQESSGTRTDAGARDGSSSTH
ncbi:MAG: protein kinase [Proteobacteria bacterium]|nr:protein kinase [Pseudomonadota bacterium]